MAKKGGGDNRGGVLTRTILFKEITDKLNKTLQQHGSFLVTTVFRPLW